MSQRQRFSVARRTSFGRVAMAVEAEQAATTKVDEEGTCAAVDEPKSHSAYVGSRLDVCRQLH